ncbi:MAG: hypothetical protein IAG13_29485 [Deltaproteobacteria bacterium]|nr:hypothetical protein [Nannocystaceae bacterium]
MSRRIPTRFMSLAIAAAMVLPTQAAARQLSTASAVVEDSAAVLGLESEDAAAGEALTKALRKAFAKRGLSGGQEMSLLELRLTMGCDGDSPKCLAEGGKAIEARRLVYGYLRKTGGSYQLKIYMLDVASAAVDRDATQPLSPADLSPGKIDATAAKIVAGMMPEESDPEAIPETGPEEVEPETTTAPEQADKPKPDRKYAWGKDRPVPTWKKAGVGVSAGLFVASLATAIGLTVALKVTLRKRLLEEVDASQTDANPNNDIDRSSDDLCAAARQTPMGEEDPKKVTNAAVTEVCNTADGVATGQLVAWIGTAVFGVATAAFVTVMFVHKRKPGSSAWQRRSPTFGLSPTRGGMVFGGGFRF